MASCLSALVGLAPSTSIYAQSTWETYEDEDCGIKIDHSYQDDTISSDSQTEFSIYPMPHFDDPDFMFVHIKVDCSKPATPITQDIMTSAKTEAMTPDTRLQGQTAVIYEDISFDRYTVDGETAGTVKAGGSSGIGETGWVENVILTNHGDKQYKINLGFVGSEGISGFGKIYSTLEEHVLNSIEFTN